MRRKWFIPKPGRYQLNSPDATCYLGISEGGLGGREGRRWTERGVGRDMREEKERGGRRRDKGIKNRRGERGKG